MLTGITMIKRKWDKTACIAGATTVVLIIVYTILNRALSTKKCFPRDKNDITVLYWTKYYGVFEFWVNKTTWIFTANDCSYLHMPSVSGQHVHPDIGTFQTCRITFDREYLDWSDAVVFHAWDLNSEDIPDARPEHQPWVYCQEESPRQYKTPYPNMFNFNWTMTYRQDSDVYAPYYHVISYNSTKSQSEFTSKPKLALWIVSNNVSDSRRDLFAIKLQQYIPIDIYGQIANPCETNTSGAANFKDCYAPLANNYKFYLSFENSLCLDYITEKFFKALNLAMVPVVYGGIGPNDYAAVAPKNSFIDWRKFKSAEELANYLLFLDNNDDEYAKYLEWKTTQKIIEGQGWCNLCQKTYTQKRLRESGQPVNRQWYSDLNKWFHNQNIKPDVIGQENVLHGQNDVEISACVSKEDFNATYVARP